MNKSEGEMKNAANIPKSDLRYAVSARGTEHVASAKRTPHTPTSFPLDFAMHLLCW